MGTSKENKDSIELQPLKKPEMASSEPVVTVVDVVENSDAERWAYATAGSVAAREFRV